MTATLATSAVARGAGISARRLNELVRAGVVAPTQPSAKQGSGARWTVEEADVVRLLVAVKRVAAPAGLAALAKALRAGRRHRVAVADCNGALRIAPAWEPAGAARGTCLIVRLVREPARPR